MRPHSTFFFFLLSCVFIHHHRSNPNSLPLSYLSLYIVYIHRGKTESSNLLFKIANRLGGNCFVTQFRGTRSIYFTHNTYLFFYHPFFQILLIPPLSLYQLFRPLPSRLLSYLFLIHPNLMHLHFFFYSSSSLSRSFYLSVSLVKGRDEECVANPDQPSPQAIKSILIPNYRSADRVGYPVRVLMTDGRSSFNQTRPASLAVTTLLLFLPSPSHDPTFVYPSHCQSR